VRRNFLDQLRHLLALALFREQGVSRLEGLTA
jgi:hypothetical protein